MGGSERILAKSNHANEIRAFAHQISRRFIRSVTELRNGLQNASPGRSCHMQSLVHHTGDGMVRDPREVSHIMERYGTRARLGMRGIHYEVRFRETIRTKPAFTRYFLTLTEILIELFTLTILIVCFEPYSLPAMKFRSSRVLPLLFRLFAGG